MSYAFVAEATLGKLAKWLRIAGFDTIYISNPLTEGLVDANGKGRILLTRTRSVIASNRSQKVVFVTSNNPFEQLKEVIGAVGIGPNDINLFSRCIRCNIPVSPVDRNSVQGIVPDHIWETHRIFHTCKGCRRIYWPGTHAEHSHEVIKRLFE